MSQDKFKTLVLNHAQCMADFKRLKKEGREEYGKCTRLAASDNWNDTCVHAAYAEQPKMCSDNGEYYSYEEVFMNMEPGPCDHCVAARRLKVERGIVGRRLGAIRAAMTRAAIAEQGCE